MNQHLILERKYLKLGVDPDQRRHRRPMPYRHRLHPPMPCRCHYCLSCHYLHCHCLPCLRRCFSCLPFVSFSFNNFGVLQTAHALMDLGVLLD